MSDERAHGARARAMRPDQRELCCPCDPLAVTPCTQHQQQVAESDGAVFIDVFRTLLARSPRAQNQKDIPESDHAVLVDVGDAGTDAVEAGHDLHAIDAAFDDAGLALGVADAEPDSEVVRVVDEGYVIDNRSSYQTAHRLPRSTSHWKPSRKGE